MSNVVPFALPPTETEVDDLIAEMLGDDAINPEAVDGLAASLEKTPRSYDGGTAAALTMAEALRRRAMTMRAGLLP